MDEVQRALAGLFGIEAPEETDEAKLRRRAKKGNDARESAALGAECLEDGDYDAAIRHFQTGIEQGAEKESALRVDLGGAFEYADREADALREFRRAGRLAEGTAEPIFAASQVLKRAGKFREALQELDRVISLEPRNAFYRYKKSEVLRELKDWDEAVATAMEAAAAAPTDSFYHYWVADLLIERRRYEEALGPMRQALELSPGDDHLYCRAAIAFWGAKRTNEAIRAIRLASELDPDKPIYHGLLALFLRQTGLNEEAAMEEKSAETMDAYDREEFARIVGLLEG